MNKIRNDHLERQAFVYVRQSTMGQVQNHVESKRRQYALADRARALGWQQVQVIDEDQGRSGSGAHRPGFERLLAALCEGQVGAVFCIDASRLARNGRDWHTLLEFCRLVDTLILDEEGVYDARQANDRLLLGMKGPARHGEALLGGLLRCGRCGRKLHVGYNGKVSLRYACKGAQVNHGADKCIAFGGVKADGLVEAELLRRLQPLGVQAALAAIDQHAHRGDERLAQKQLALEQAQFEVARARRQFDAVDPDNRLVAAELERRWNEAIKTHSVLEQELQMLRAHRPAAMSRSAREALLKLGEDLPALWRHPMTSAQQKKRIVRTVLHEIVVNVDGERVCMVLHWHGGDHSELQFLKNKTGQHRYIAPQDVVALVRDLARVQPDRNIASILNRLGRRTGRGHTWTEGRIRAFRGTHDIAVYQEGERLARGELTLEETAKMLKISTESVRRMIAQRMLIAQQACTGAPWVIQRAEVDRLVAATNNGDPHTSNSDQISLDLQ